MNDCIAFVRLITRPAPCDALCERFGLAFAAHDETRRRHRAGNDAQHARARRRRALAMHDHFALLAVDHVPFFPGEVVVVLDIEDDLARPASARCICG